MENQPRIRQPTDNTKSQFQKYLDKLYTYNITTLTQIQNKNNKVILTLKEIRTTYKHVPKSIKATLQQAQILFPHPQPPIPQRNPQLAQQADTNYVEYPHPLQPVLGQAIHKIVKGKNH